METYNTLIKEVSSSYKNHQQCITKPKIYKQTCPKYSPNTISTFPKIWSRVMLAKYWDFPRRSFFLLLIDGSLGEVCANKTRLNCDFIGYAWRRYTLCSAEIWKMIHISCRSHCATFFTLYLLFFLKTWTWSEVTLAYFFITSKSWLFLKVTLVWN